MVKSEGCENLVVGMVIKTRKSKGQQDLSQQADTLPCSFPACFLKKNVAEFCTLVKMHLNSRTAEQNHIPSNMGEETETVNPTLAFCLTSDLT